MPNVVFDLVYRDHGVERGLDRVSDKSDKAARRSAAWGKAAAAGFLVIGAAALKFGKDSVKAYSEAQTAQAKLSDAFSRFPKLADTNQAALQKLNTERQKSTRFDDDATAAAQAQLAQYKLTGQQLTELTPLIQDYAARTGKDLPTAARDAGKAVLGQGRAFKSIGLDLKDTGTATGNYTQLVEGLRTQVGGFAEKEGKTAAGQVEILKNQFGELQEQAGEKLLPTVSAVVGGLTDLVEVVGENSEVIVPLVGTVAGLTTVLWLGHKAAKAYAAAQTLIGSAMTSNSKIVTGAASVLGKAGPWGAAVVGGAALLGAFVFAEKKANDEAKAFTDALTFQGDALDDNSRQMLIKKLADEGALEAARNAGVAESDYVRALLQGGPARDRVLDQLYDAEEAARANADALQGNTTELLDQANASGAAADTLKTMGTNLDASKRSAELAETAFKGSSDATADQAETAEEAKKRLDELADSMFAATRAALALSGSQIGYEQAVDDATAAAKENGKTLNLNTQKGRDNKKALDNLVTSSQSYISELVRTDASSKRVQGATKNAKEEFIRVARQMGIGADRAKDLADKYYKVPKKVTTKTEQPGMKKARDDTHDLDERINALNNKSVDINYTTNAGRLADAFHLGLTLNSGEQKDDGGSIAQVGNQAGGPALTFSHGHGPESGGPGIQRTISSPVHGRPNAPRFDTLTNRLSRGIGAQLGRRIGAKLDDMDADSGAPGGSVATRSGGLQTAMAVMRAQGARSFTTYPGHHPSMARARDVTPHSWAIANAARAIKGIWYVIYRMKIASKNHGNVWRDYHPTNHRGDWRHERHVHIASYDRGGTLRPGLTLAVNNTGRNEYVRGPGRGGGGDTYYVTVNAPQYVGDKKDLANAMYSLAVEGRLNAPLRKAGVRV